MSSPNRAKKQPPAPARSRTLRFVDRTGPPEVLIFAATVATGLWSWLANVVTQPQDFTAFAWLFFGASIVGAMLQMVMFAFVRAPGTFRERASLQSVSKAGSGSGVVFWGVPILFAVGLVLVTPPSTPATAFDPSMSIYQVIFLVAGLSLASTLLGGFVLFGLVVLPLMWIIAGALPEQEPAPGRPAAAVSRGELVTGGLLLFAVAGFGVAMYAVAPNVTGGAFGTRLRMLEQLSALLTLRGDLLASAIVVLCLAAIVVLVVLNHRYASRRTLSNTSAQR
ncbi:MAG: hypothetical protein ABI130_16750 [Leifsonia sp.]